MAKTRSIRINKGGRRERNGDWKDEGKRGAKMGRANKRKKPKSKKKGSNERGGKEGKTKVNNKTIIDMKKRPTKTE
jgi:hypothetical protein